MRTRTRISIERPDSEEFQPIFSWRNLSERQDSQKWGGSKHPTAVREGLTLADRIELVRVNTI